MKQAQGVQTEGTCFDLGMMAMLERRSLRPILAMSTPSMTMLPPQSSCSLNRQLMSELLPAPVRPTTPHRDPGDTFTERPAQHQRQPVPVPHLHIPEVHLRTMQRCMGGFRDSGTSLVSTVRAAAAQHQGCIVAWR